MIKGIRFGFLALILAAACVYAEEGYDVGYDEEGNSVEARLMADLDSLAVREHADDVEVTYVFPDNEDLVITSGEVVEIVAGFRNNAKNKMFNITGVDASLHWPADYNFILQNFSGIDYLIGVIPESEVSFIYGFIADPLLEPTEFGLVVNVYYTDRVNNYSSVIVNTTIELVEADTSVDPETLATYATAAIVTIIVLLVGYFFLSSSGKKAPRKVERGTTSSGEPENEWLVGTHAK